MAAEPNAAPAGRKRRAPGEGRELLLDAAREVFSERGYAGTSTREIASRAGIAEALLFRNFGSKASLFTAVASGIVTEFTADWEDFVSGLDDRYPEDQLIAEFVGRLYDHLRANRGLMLSYIATSLFEPEVMGSEHPTLMDALRELARGAERQFADHSIIGMIMFMALFEEWPLAEAAKAPDRDAVVEELTSLILYGLERPPPAPVRKASRARR